ncbi:MAG: DHH family phosphoesterase [Planctomycetota bacterium]|nr:DHH family phosphoesterase [Planctomycetota bacterium]
MSIDWKRFKEIIDANQRFLLTSHIRPDCDALGSELGMARVLRALGKEVVIVNGHESPPNLAFMDSHGELKALGKDVQPQELDGLDVMMVLDTSAWAQLGPMGDVLKTTTAKRIVLDHHVSSDDLDAEVFRDIQAEATGRLVVEAAEALGVELTADMASVLYAAQATDTGWYRYASVTGRAMRIAAELIDAGAVPQEIYADLYEQDTLARLNLRGRILARAQTKLDGRLIYTSVLQEDFEETGAHPSDTEDVINLTLCVSGVEMAVILVWLSKGGYKVSFRSRCDVDCSKLAASFGGGGHKAAAGASIDAPYNEVLERVLDAVSAAMK